MKTLNATMLGAIALLGNAMSVNALVVIDDFTTGSASISVNGSAGVGASATSTDVAATNTIGGFRDVKITLQDTTGIASAISADVNPPTGVFSFNAKAGDVNNDNRGTLLLTYDGLSGAGLDNIDLTEGGFGSGITIDFIAADAGSSMTIDVTDGGTTASRTLLSSGPGPLFFQFADFTNPSALLSADAINITIVGTAAGDYTIDQITTRNPGQPPAGVPEPVTASLSLMGLSALALTATRRRQNRSTLVS